MHRWTLATIALAVLQLGVSASVCPSAPAVQNISDFCQSFRKVCIDQESYVLYGTEHNPTHESFVEVPQISLDNIYMDYYGFADVWNTAFLHPQPLVRPATRGEESKELSSPQFTSCTIPLIFYANYVYSYGEFFLRTVVNIYLMQQKGYIDRAVTFAVSTLGQALEPWQSFLLVPFSIHPPTTLSHLSSRADIDTPETYSPDGRHVRCFYQLYACQMNFMVTPSDETLFSPKPLWSTGQIIMQHYKDSLPPLNPELKPDEEGFDDPSKLRVLIVARRRSHTALRSFTNQEQVWSWCTKFEPPKDAKNWNGAACKLHELGPDPLKDLSLLSRADVLLGLHGSGLLRGFFMAQHTSVVEVRPYQFAGQRADMQMKRLTSELDQHSLFWWGIDVVDPAHAAPGILEATSRGNKETWTRDRHTHVRLMALQYIFERISITRRNKDIYMHFNKLGQNHINDQLQIVNATLTA